MLQYRIKWHSFTNINFRGAGPWREWDDPEASHDDIEKALNRGKQTIDGLEEALHESGFEWDIETREATDGGDD